MMRFHPLPLPIDKILPELRAALAKGHAVLSSPPGSGKTTRVPLALLHEPWLASQKIIVLEPRRPAVRMAARFMAGLQGEPVGQSVGYQVRMERRIGSQTRIEVLTEGLLIRRLQSDPELTGVGLVIFDEFHEQSLQSELGLALCLDVCTALRTDLRLLIMSATLDEQAVAQLIDGQVVASDGGLYPVAVHYLPRSAGKELLPVTIKLVDRALHEQQGDILLFLPGKGEINQLERQLLTQGIAAEIFQLHGEMDASAQARVLLPEHHHPRRVILATDVAETSLTIPGITAVIDSGLSRKPVFDPNSGLSSLRLSPIARAAADQRAGRAGRLGPGVCYRAWTEHEQRQRPAQRPAEILQADLAPLVLELALWGVTSPERMNWSNPPPVAAWSQAVELLQELEAIDDSGRITTHGKQLATLGLHPRLAHMLVRGGSNNRVAADIAALLSDRDPWRQRPGTSRPADLGLRLQAMEALRDHQRPATPVDSSILRQLLRLSRQLQHRCRHLPATRDDLSPGALLSLAYPERIAQRRSDSHGRYLMVSGKGGALPADDALIAAPYLAVAHMDAGSREGRIWLAMALEQEELQAVQAAQIRQQRQLQWDRQRAQVTARRVIRLGAILLSSQELPAGTGPEVLNMLLQAIRETGLDCLEWSGGSQQLLARMRLARGLDTKGDWPDVSQAWLLENLEHWLAPWLEGKRALSEVHKLDLQALLLARMTWEQQRQLERLLPPRWLLTDGSSAAIDYRCQPPVLAIPLQKMYGVAQTPAVCHGTQPLLLHLLSPAGRPLQMTTDLLHFWANAWHEVQKEMRGRYPKHHWPDDPLHAKPVMLKRHL